jgi:hypothetical protein
MSPLWTLAAWQCRSSLTGMRGRLAVGFWCLIVALAAWAGASAAFADRATYAAGEQANQEHYAAWLAAYGGDPWRPVFLSAESPLVLQKPPAPARALAGGVEDVAGSWATIGEFGVAELEGRKADLSPLGALAGGLDLATVVALAGALLAIALSYDAIAGEFERGTIAPTFANPLGRGTFLLGKALGALAATSLALQIPLGLGLLALLACGALPPTPDGWLRAGGFFIAAWLYLGFWSLATVAVSAASRTSAGGFALLAAGWLLVAVAWPKAALLVAEGRHPLPAPALQAQRQAEVLQAGRERYRALLAAYRAAHGGSRPEGADASRVKLAYLDGIYAGLAPLAADWQRARAARAATFVSLASLSPAFAFQRVAFGLAGTDAERYEAFLAAADRNVRDLKYEAEARFVAGRTAAPPLAELPRPAFTEPGAAACLAARLAELGLLVAAALLALALALLAFQRRDLRVG